MFSHLLPRYGVPTPKRRSLPAGEAGREERRDQQRRDREAEGVAHRVAGQAGGVRRCVRGEEAPEEHRQGRVDRRHHLPRRGGAPHHRDGPRAAAQRARAPTGQPPRYPTPASEVNPEQPRWYRPSI